MKQDYEYLSCIDICGRLLTETNEEGGTTRYFHNRIRKQTESHVEDYTYDERNRLVQKQLWETGATVPADTTTYTYDAQGSLLREQSTDLCRQYLYNDFHQCIGTEVIRGREEEAERILQENRYDGEGLRFSLIENGNCICKETLAGVTEYGYDVMNCLSEQSGPFGRECCSYDYADNRTSREWFAAVDGDIHPEHMDTRLPDMEMPVADIPLGSECYEYDERNRLVRSILSKGNGGEDIIREYTYDNQGNLLSDGQATKWKRQS